MLPKKGCSCLHPPTKAWGSPAPPQWSSKMAPLPILWAKVGTWGPTCKRKNTLNQSIHNLIV